MLQQHKQRVQIHGTVYPYKCIFIYTFFVEFYTAESILSKSLQ